MSDTRYYILLANIMIVLHHASDEPRTQVVSWVLAALYILFGIWDLVNGYNRKQ